MVAPNHPNDIRIIRVYDASVKAVWDAWTDPAQVAQWWGPRGFSLTTHSKELRPGGIWHYTMHGPDGVDYPNKTLYYEVEEFRKLVYDHGANDDRPPMFRVTVLFSEENGKTTMDMTMTLPTAEQAEAARKFIKAAGGYATWDRLAEYLRKEIDGRTTFVINRSFEIPIEQLFQIWTSAEQLPKWLPPDGFEMKFLRADFRKGGDCFYRMSNDAGMAFYGRHEYLEIDSPSRIIYVQRFCDENDNVTHHPALPVFPSAMLVNITLVAEDDRWTRVTLHSEPFGVVSQEEVEAFSKLRTSMTSGWSGSFDKIEMLI